MTILPETKPLSPVVDISRYNTHGLCKDYTLRRHHRECEADAGSHEARSDWRKYVGPVDQFGGCNPINGNFSAVVLPFCQPDRLRLSSYIVEFAFIQDTLVERELEQHDDQMTSQEMGKKKIQAKIAMELTSKDLECGQHVLKVWKEMLATTKRSKNTLFQSLGEYVDFRIVDTGAPFMDALMLFGMGVTLTSDERKDLEGVVKPCYAALGLENDYFSFDREYREFKEAESHVMINLIWLLMKWQDVTVHAAKDLAREIIKQYEDEFLRRCADYRPKAGMDGKKIQSYLKALSHMVSGNVVWSLNCPRYHPQFRYDPNACIEIQLRRIEWGQGS